LKGTSPFANRNIQHKQVSAAHKLYLSIYFLVTLLLSLLFPFSRFRAHRNKTRLLTQNQIPFPLSLADLLLRYFFTLSFSEPLFIANRARVDSDSSRVRSRIAPRSSLREETVPCCCFINLDLVIRVSGGDFVWIVLIPFFFFQDFGVELAEIMHLTFIWVLRNCGKGK
jgi:hypothetical protein